MLTAMDTAGLGAQAIALGFKGYATKPVRQSQLFNCIIAAVCGDAAIIAKTAAAAQDTFTPAVRHRELILVAEDNIINQQVAQIYLDTMGYSCDIAANGQAAIDANNSTEYALILMDSQMPDIDGLTATKLIREGELKSGKHIPIIAMTASALKGDRERFIAAGMDDYISKPIDIAPLQSMIEKWLPKSISTDDQVDQSPVQIEHVKAVKLFDLKVINERYAEHSRRLINLFTTEVPIQIARLNQACTDRNQQDLLDAAHGLKGLCSTLTAESMRDMCAESEGFGRDLDWPKARFCISRLELEFARLQTYLATAQAVP